MKEENIYSGHFLILYAMFGQVEDTKVAQVTVVARGGCIS